MLLLPRKRPWLPNRALHNACSLFIGEMLGTLCAKQASQSQRAEPFAWSELHILLMISAYRC